MNDEIDAVARLVRWEASGAVWRVVDTAQTAVTVTLCTCDGGEEVDQLTSDDPLLRSYVRDRRSSEEAPAPIDAVDLAQMAADLIAVPGVVGVMLGGSRSRGDALPSSDVDLGVYYEGTPPAAELSSLASRWTGAPVEVGGSGSWGPWVDGGGWLTVRGTAVDWILRDIDRVRLQTDRAVRGEYAFHTQPGHPLGFLDVAYAGEVALGQVLADPSGTLGDLQATLAHYPPALRDSMIAGMWEADFLIAGAAKALKRDDAAYIVLCLTKAIMVSAHALYADAGRWVTNEKGLIPYVDKLSRHPIDFAARAATALRGGVGGADVLTESIAQVQQLVNETTALLAGPS